MTSTSDYSLFTSHDFHKLFHVKVINDQVIDNFCTIIKNYTNIIRFEHIYILLRYIKYNFKISNINTYYELIISSYLHNYEFTKEEVSEFFQIVETTNVMKNILAKNLDILPLNTYLPIYLRFITYYTSKNLDFINKNNIKEVTSDTILNIISKFDKDTQKNNYELVILFSDIFTKDDVFSIIACFNNYAMSKNNLINFFCDVFTYSKEEIKKLIIMSVGIDIIIKIDKKCNITTIFSEQELIELLHFIHIFKKCDYIKYLNEKYDSIQKYIRNNKDDVYRHFRDSTTEIYKYLLTFWYKNNFEIDKKEIEEALCFIKDDSNSNKVHVMVTFIETFLKLFTFEEVVSLLEKYNIKKIHINTLLDINTCTLSDLILASKNLSPYECFKLINSSTYIRSDHNTIINLINQIPLLITSSQLDKYIDSYIFRIKILEFCNITKFDDVDKIMQLLNTFKEDKHKKHILEFISKNSNFDKNLLLEIATQVFNLNNEEPYTKYMNIDNYIDYYDTLLKDRSVSFRTINYYGTYKYNIFDDCVSECGFSIQMVKEEKFIEVKNKIIDMIIYDITRIPKNKEIKSSSFIFRQKNKKCIVIEDTQIVSNKQNNSDTEDNNMCTICFERKYNMAFNCGHVICDVCNSKIMEQERPICPMCRKDVKTTIKLFINSS